MIYLSPLRSLTLTQTAQAERHAYISSASGLVKVGKWLYVVGDDENHLGVFLQDSREQGIPKILFEGTLSITPEERKAEKPDLEVLTLIPPSNRYPSGALLALGSGSKKTRMKGAIIPLLDNGELQDNLEVVDLKNLYHALKNEIGKLNIEGAVLIADDILLFQRGNKKNKVNATVRFPIKQFFDCIFSSGKKSGCEFDFEITQYDLGDIAGVPLCFTDATALANGDIVFSAAAENTSDSYLDGVCMGSAIGIIKSSGKLHGILIVDQNIKIEGIAADLNGDKIELLLVTDADNDTIPAQLYSAVLQKDFT